MEYDILEAMGPSELVELVREKIGEGWKPNGAPFLFDGDNPHFDPYDFSSSAPRYVPFVYQAVTREVPK